MRFALVLLLLVALACIAGSILPQGADAAKYLEAHPEAEARMRLFAALGLTQVFYSPWFIALLCILGASLGVCSARRFSRILTSTGAARGRAIGSVLTHISLLVIFSGGIIRGLWGEKGYLGMREGETRAHFQGRLEHREFPFKVHLKKFEIEMYEADPAEAPPDFLVVKWKDTRREPSLIPVKPGVEQVLLPEGESAGSTNAYRFAILQYIPDFIVDSATGGVKSRSNEPNNPAILVSVKGPNLQVERWLFARFPNFRMHAGEKKGDEEKVFFLFYQVNTAARNTMSGTVKDYRSTLQIIEDGSVVLEKTIEVNDPLRYQGYALFQSGYNPEDLSWSSFQVVKDPGVLTVYTGFALMIAGVFTVLYIFPPERVRAQMLKTPEPDSKS